MLRMTNPSSYSARQPQRRLAGTFLLVILAAFALSLSQTPAQSDVGGGDAGACTLKNHVYTCDGAAFQKALAAATAVKIETHNADGVARSKLNDLVTKKLGKTIAPQATPADLDFLLIPIDEPGVNNSPGDVDLGTLRIYTVTAGGARGHLLWAETYSGQQDLPWPAVVRSVILQFQSRFHIK
jgi:hypothetical protein